MFLGAGASVLVGMMLWSISRPSPEEKAAVDFSRVLLAGNPESMTLEQRESLRRQWERFSPETRKEIFFRVSRENLARVRAETEKMSPEERRTRIDAEVRRLQARRQRLSEEERQEIRERLQTQEAREMVKAFMEFYSTEMTAKERAELDPLVNEWLTMVEGRY